MKKVKVYNYYAFGYDYSLIRESNLKNYKKENAVSILTNFLTSIDTLNIPVTKNIAKDFHNVLKEIKKLDLTIITEEISKKIKKEVDRIDSALDSELSLKETFILTEKKYSIENLMNNPFSLLSDNSISSLTTTSKKDFTFACTLIALNQPTGSAFHLMRALEEQVKVLYFNYKKTNRLSKPMWGPIVQQLRAKRNPKPSEKLLNLLDGMRAHFRNPTQHPDTFYTIDEAEDLLNQTISAINIIAKELR